MKSITKKLKRMMRQRRSPVAVNINNITFQFAAVSNLASIVALDRTGWATAGIADGSHAWRLWIDNALVFCCMIDSEVIGFALAFPCLSGYFAVHKLLIKDGFRGYGLGGKLFNRLIQELDMLGLPSFLTVDPNNKRAVKLYKSLGYTLLAEKKGYYSPGEDRLIMTRDPS